MKQLLKQSEGSAIASEHNVFFWARLKLTSIYVLILAVILIGFSFFLYQNISRNLIDANEDASFTDQESHHHFAESTLNEVQNEIMFVDIFILIVAAGVSYVLAGYTLRPIQDALSAQKKFSENASHELRTPLAVMKNDVEVLLRNPNPTKEVIHTTLRSNVEEIDKLAKMAEDLLFLARTNNHRASVHESVDLTKIAKRMVEKMRPIAEKKDISLGTSVAESLQIRGNESAVERVLVNLLQNAIEHTSKNGSITVDVHREASHIVLKVTDTGSGISEADLVHIFERFYKGEGAQGTGLGLAIVKELITQHDGSIDVTSAKGVGTTVAIKLPAIA